MTDKRKSIVARIKGLQVGFGKPPKPGSRLIPKTYKRPDKKAAPKAQRRPY